MLSSTLFFGATRSAKEFVDVIVQVDTQMTNLKKVMSDDTDFGKVFQDATENAKTYAKTITEVLEATNEYARQGFKGDELNDLTQAGLVTSNVGEMTSLDASQFITSTLIQWKKDTKDAMGIIDNWNELSNNYAGVTR